MVQASNYEVGGDDNHEEDDDNIHADIYRVNFVGHNHADYNRDNGDDQGIDHDGSSIEDANANFEIENESSLDGHDDDEADNSEFDDTNDGGCDGTHDDDNKEFEDGNSCDVVAHKMLLMREPSITMNSMQPRMRL